MESSPARPRVLALALTLVVAIVGAAAAPPADAARSTDPTVDIQSAASLAPDGSTITVQLIASCPSRWVAVEAHVDVSQPQASGRGPFSVACTGSLTPVTVNVPAASGAFALGEARVTVLLRIQRGRTAEATDAADVLVQPAVVVRFTGAARLDGADVLVDLVVACPVGSTGQQSYVNVTGEQGSGNGLYLPVCDGRSHTITVRVEPAQGVFVPGCARALTFATVEHGGISFTGVADTLIEIGV